jgi:hypothetical protein
LTWVLGSVSAEGLVLSLAGSAIVTVVSVLGVMKVESQWAVNCCCFSLGHGGIFFPLLFCCFLCVMPFFLVVISLVAGCLSVFSKELLSDESSSSSLVVLFLASFFLDSFLWKIGNCSVSWQQYQGWVFVV